MYTLPDIFIREKECYTMYQNVSLSGAFCKTVWENLFCWPPTLPGATTKFPCPKVDTEGNIFLDVNDTENVAFRICDQNGEWLENKTDDTKCWEYLSNEPTVVPMIVFYIIVICSVISLITLFISLFIFCYFKCLLCSRLRVHRNLSVSLIMYLTLLLVPFSTMVSSSETTFRDLEWLCKTILCLSLYSALASINWMFVEGLLLHSRVTVSIFKQDAPFKLYYFIGWGFPAILIGTWAAIMSQVTSAECWDDYGTSNFIWLITGPMMVALLVNTVFLVNIIRVIMNKYQANATEEITQVKRAIKATALLFPLLGIPHLIFCINPKDNGNLDDAYFIINAFIKSSQGMFLSIFYCFMNADVQTALRNAYLRSAIQRNPNYSYQRGRGMSQTSATYVSNSDGNLHDVSRHRNSSRAVLRMHELPSPHKNCVTVLEKNETQKSESSTPF